MCEEARKKETSVEKAMARNANSIAQVEAENLSLNKLNSEIERVHSSKSELSVQLSRQLKKLDSSTLKLKDLRSKIEQMNQKSRETNDKANLLLQPYRDYLGLTLQTVKSDGSLRIMFQLPNSKVCYVKLTNKDGVFRITKSVPMLKELDRLEAKLAETNNFPGFVAKLHSLFRKEL